MSDNLEQDLDEAFIAPDTFFKGEKLAPYTEGSRLLMLQVRDEADSAIYFVWSFVYIHILLAQDRRAAIKLAWDRDAFREKLLDWSENMTRRIGQPPPSSAPLCSEPPTRPESMLYQAPW